MFDPKEVEHIYVLVDGELRPALMMHHGTKWEPQRDKGGIYRGTIGACWVTAYNTLTFTAIIQHVSQAGNGGRYWMRFVEARRRFPNDPLFTTARHEFTDEERGQ
jgi:Fe-S cluster biogenesis protein NfuA